MSKAVIPNLPPISSIKDPDVRVALESMWNAWRVRNGDVGDGEHKFLTSADLKDAVNSIKIVRGSGGTLGTGSGSKGTATWVGPLIATIQDDIMQSWLWKKLGERINWIETPDWFVDKFDRSFGTAIKNEQVIRESAVSSLASSISTVSAVLNGNIAVVQQTLTANVTLTEATASSLTLLKSEFDNTTAGFQQEISTVANSVSALSESTTQYITQINGNIGLIQQDVQSVTDLAGSHTSQITTLQNSVSGVAVSAQQAFDLATTVEGKVNGAWTVKFDANGYVTGAGLGLEGKDGAYSSSFLVRADKFAIGSPQHPSITPTVPFVVYTTPTNIAGRVVNPGVYMDSAFITRLTADQIDTRGLTIKDAAGNVIFGSGYPLSTANISGLGSLATLSSVSTSQVTGLGSLATQNSVDYSAVTGTKPPSNADKTSLNIAAGFSGQGAFATLNSITSANISTYIASGAIGRAYIGAAAIGYAQIGDLEVDTIKIKSGAITNGASVSSGSSPSSVGITTAGGVVYVWAQFSVPDGYYDVYLTRDGAAIKVAGYNLVGQSVSGVLIARDTPASGYHTYAVSVGGSSSGPVYDVVIMVLEAKR